MAWFRKDKKPLTAKDRREVPKDIFDKCPGCGEICYGERLAQNLNICPVCNHHMRLSVEAYLSILLDRGTFKELDQDLSAADPLGFNDLKSYPERIASAEAEGKREAVVTGTGNLDGIDIVIAVMDFEFIAGSMGSVVGEKITRAANMASDTKVPIVIVSASGGARMQEGIYSLMQMAKTSLALSRLHDDAIPYVSILTHPTTGGVTASYSMLGDVNLAEPGALIGFAGPRVIEETISQGLPEGFQSAEFVRDHGMIDGVVDRRQLKDTVATILRHQYAGWDK
ncbi:MAG: acetyl-CoA carboxylase, carboxyltransferase subunit beta [Gemmatimonadota bacterium]|nr:acetyl-CoA carboxylase, carboxyltransferase subunit beta [Gemmatimonadota bacterium]